MKTFNLSIPVLVNHFNKHEEMKPFILSAIEAAEADNVAEETQRIYKTDFFKRTNQKAYLPFVVRMFNQHLVDLNNYFKYPKDLSVDEYWFQQYNVGDYHSKHLHLRSILSNVYYVELPDGAAKTNLILPDGEMTIDVKEGDILTFPSFIMHESKPNQVGRKTVVAFNI